jgi:predicted nuclease with TOPRIM domain
MSSIGVVWTVLKMAATRIPWGRVVENAPAVVDLVGRARDRFKPSVDDLEERLQSIQAENLKLEKMLQATADHLQQITDTLKVVSARQKMLTICTVVSLLTAITALILWAGK